MRLVVEDLMLFTMIKIVQELVYVKHVIVLLFLSPYLGGSEFLQNLD